MTDDDTARIALIKKAFIFCGEEPSDEAVARQFRYETGRELGGKHGTKRRRRRRRKRASPND